MNEPGPSRASQIAYAVAVLFVIRLLSFFIPASSPIQVRDGTLPGALLGIAPHLLLFPVVAALPAPQWAKAAGWGWLAIDMSTDIMALNGVPNTIFLPLRYGGHISAALWILGASWQTAGVVRIVGVLLALNLGAYSFIAPWVSFFALFPSILLLPGWFALIGPLLARASTLPSIRT